MIRILLPLAVIAAILFGPLMSETVTGSQTGAREDMLSGTYFVGDALQCLREQITDKSKIDLDGQECQVKGGDKGKMILYAVIAAAVAAAVGVIGILPVVGRLTSIVTAIAGVVIVATIGYFSINMLGGTDTGESLQWGAYLAGGGGLLTLISGLAGMRGH